MMEKLKYYFNFILSTCIFIFFIFYGLYNFFVIKPANKEYAKNNPYLYKSIYYHNPSKEYVYALMGQLTNYDHSFYDEFYIHKGMPSDNIRLSRYFKQDKTSEILNNLKNHNNIFLFEDNHYCLGEINIVFEMYKGDYYISISWSKDSDCRLYWWEGKNPRGLQSNIFKEYHKNGKQYNLIQVLEKDDENAKSEK